MNFTYVFKGRGSGLISVLLLPLLFDADLSGSSTRLRFFRAPLTISMITPGSSNFAILSLSYVPEGLSCVGFSECGRVLSMSCLTASSYSASRLFMVFRLFGGLLETFGLAERT